jgi:deoxyadenosine/deoxycytidine kinase
MKKWFVAIAGNIGVGKSSLTGMLGERLGWEPFFEAVSDNPYLADFYQDMARWSFHSQVFFLSRRLRHHHQLLQRPNSVVQDRTVYEDAEVFACNLYRQGLMSERDYRSYRELYEVIERAATTAGPGGLPAGIGPDADGPYCPAGASL